MIPYQNTNMKEPKHTNGRWKAERSQDAGGYFEWFVRRDGDTTAIASDITDPETGQPSEANAALVAAAPELLEALIAQERADWARRNYEGISDPLHPDKEALNLEMIKTMSHAATLRKEAIAKAKPQIPTITSL